MWAGKRGARVGLCMGGRVALINLVHARERARARNKLVEQAHKILSQDVMLAALLGARPSKGMLSRAHVTNLWSVGGASRKGERCCCLDQSIYMPQCLLLTSSGTEASSRALLSSFSR